jgi:uncharacterized membrane protein YbhN (UPF0104 family)
VHAALDAAAPGWIVLAAAFALAGQLVAVLGFRALLQTMSHTLPYADVARLYFVSQLGKYVPGSVWPIVALAEMSRKHGIPRRGGTVAASVALLFSLATGAIVGIVFTVAGAAQHRPELWWLMLIVPVGIALLHPRFIAAAVHRVLHMARREPLDIDLSGPPLRGAIGWPAVSWLLMGLQCWALCVAFGAPELKSLAPAIGGFALAYAAGTIFVPAPAGVGVREAVLGVALVGVVHHSTTFTHDDIVVVVLLSRVLLAVLDFAQAGVAEVVSRARARRPVAGT